MTARLWAPADSTRAPTPAAVDDTAWLRLDSRVVVVDVVIFVLSLVPGVVGSVFFDIGFDSGSYGIWPALVATTVGVVGSLADLFRWLKTRYRVTDDRIERRTGWIWRKYRSVARDRIRSVDTTARLRHRLAGLAVVHIGSGEQQPSFKLDAVSVATAGHLRQELMGTPPETATAASDGSHAEETVLSRLRWSWALYNLVNVWAFGLSAFLLWSAYWLLQIVGVDLGELLGSAVDWAAMGTGWSIVVAVGGAFVLGVVGLGVTFVTENWGFHLVRTTTQQGSTLLTRQGLLRRREVHRDESRVRGLHLSEPLFWRWMGLAEIEVVSTGLAGWSVGVESASSILPRGPVGEARRVARLALTDGLRPLEARLDGHPRAALYRRAVGVAAGVVGAGFVFAWLHTTGVVHPDWRMAGWLVLSAAAPAGIGLAVIAYRSLGHARVGPYVVLRRGLWRRSTVALQDRAVIGWSLRQSLLQRFLGLVTVGVATPAGARFYSAPDMSVDTAVSFAAHVTPDLIQPFLDHRVGGADAPADGRRSAATDSLPTPTR